MEDRTQPSSSEQIHRAEEAKQLLANDIFAEALTAIAEDALEQLTRIDPDDKNGIIRQQAIVQVARDLPTTLTAFILRTGEKDGGVTA